MGEKNGTIYYGTDDGKISATRVDATAGFALTAAFYLFIRFFLAGAVTRARGRLDSNENRNVVLKYIVDHPGSGLYEICRGLKMNKGTARYHLLILGVNHRIISFKADDKYVRYFKNSGSYSAEEQLVFSIVRREGVKKVLCKLLEKPGLSNLELSREVGLRETATLRYMKELMAKGIVVKDKAPDGKMTYSIKNEYERPVSFAINRLNGS